MATRRTQAHDVQESIRTQETTTTNPFNLENPRILELAPALLPGAGDRG